MTAPLSTPCLTALPGRLSWHLANSLNRRSHNVQAKQTQELAVFA